MIGLLLWAQILWGSEWGESTLPWTLYGAELRKTSAVASPRAYTLLLNGADAAGLPYQTDNPRLQGPADSALSDCIPLSGPAFVAFAYQRGGLMEPPEADDTLSLWGLTAQGTWERLWHAEGTLQADSTFTVVYLPLDEPKWFHSCLRLKWTTWGSTYGAYDNWFIAYTYVQADTVNGPVGYFRQLPRVYGGAYGSWPPEVPLPDSLLTVQVEGQVGTQATLTLYQGGSPLVSRPVVLGVQDTFQLRAPRPTVPGRYALSWELSTPSASPIVLQDTLKLEGSVWGYDDDEPETGYGLRQLGVAACQEFRIDSVRQIIRVGMRFFAVPTQYGKPFQLGIWQLDAGTAPLYVKFERVSVDSPWVWFLVDTPVVVQGRVGVGFLQADDRPLGIGWDASYTGEPRVWVQSGTGWTPSRLAGCMLLRIETAPATTALSSAGRQRLTLPTQLRAGELFWIEGSVPVPIRVWNASGQLVAVWTAGSQQAPLSPGLYFLQPEGMHGSRLLVLP